MVSNIVNTQNDRGIIAPDKALNQVVNTRDNQAIIAPEIANKQHNVSGNNNYRNLQTYPRNVADLLRNDINQVYKPIISNPHQSVFSGTTNPQNNIQSFTQPNSLGFISPNQMIQMPIESRHVSEPPENIRSYLNPLETIHNTIVDPRFEISNPTSNLNLNNPNNLYQDARSINSPIKIFDNNNAGSKNNPFNQTNQMYQNFPVNVVDQMDSRIPNAQSNGGIINSFPFINQDGSISTPLLGSTNSTFNRDSIPNPQGQSNSIVNGFKIPTDRNGFNSTLADNLNNRNFFDNGNNHNYNAQTNNSDYRSINNTNNQNLTQNQQNSDPRVNSPSIFDGNNNPHLKSPGDNFSQVNHNNSPNNLANAPNGNQSYLAQQNINSPQIRGQLNQTMLPTIGNNMIISNVPDTKPLTDQNINNYSPLNYYPQPTTQFPNTNANYIPLNSMQQQSYLPSNNGFHNIGNLNASRQETRENIVDSRGTDMQMIPQQPNPFGINNGNANRVSQNGYAVNPNYFTDPSSNPFNNNLQYGANINNSRPTTQSSQHHSSNNGIQPQSFHINGNQPENLFHPQSLSVANMSYQQPVQSFVNNDKNRLNEFSIPSTNFMSNYSVPHYEHNSPISNESMPSNFNYESRNSRSSPGQMRPSNNFQFEPVDLNRYSANNTKRIPNRNDNSGNNLFKQNETGRVNPFPFSNRSKWATDEDEQLFQSSLKGNEVNRHSATTPSTMFGLRPNTSKVPLYNRKLSEKKHNVPNSKRIIRLHKTADKLCMKVLSGDENSKKAMKHLLRGIELWQDKKNVPSGKLFHSVVSMNLIDDETADLAIDCIKLCEDSVRPIEIDEIYSKMLDIFHHHSVESYKNESNNDLLSPKKHDTTVKLGVKETNLVPKKKDQFSVTCESSCQTMPEGKSFDMFQHKGPKVEMTNYLPEDFYFVHYDSSVFELLPGMYLANDNMIKSALLSSGQMESKLPSKVRYVYTSNTSKLTLLSPYL